MPVLVCRLADGLLLSVAEPGDPLTHAILEDWFELNERDFIARTVHAGHHVIDIGAHVGAHTLRLAARVVPDGTVTAIEPVPVHVARLRESVGLNDLAGIVTVLQAAAGDTPGRREMIVGGPDLASCNAWLRPDGYGEPGLRTECVDVVRVDDLALPRPQSFIKVDAEGAEGLILAGARTLLIQDRPVLLVDLHPHLLPRVSGATAQQVIHAMATLGYTCHLLGAGVAGAVIDDLPSSVVTPVVFRPA